MTLVNAVTSTVPLTPQATPLVAASQAPSSGLTFGDIIDAINPLQHIPVISGLYRAVTGTQISAGAKIAGDTLYGALLPGGAIASFASSLADVAVKETTGSDISKHVIDTVTAAIAPEPSQTVAQAALVPVAASTLPNTIPSSALLPHVPAIPLAGSSRHAQSSAAQYQRAQALDAVHRKLVKMTA